MTKSRGTEQGRLFVPPELPQGDEDGIITAAVLDFDETTSTAEQTGLKVPPTYRAARELVGKAAAHDIAPAQPETYSPGDDLSAFDTEIVGLDFDAQRSPGWVCLRTYDKRTGDKEIARTLTTTRIKTKDGRVTWSQCKAFVEYSEKFLGENEREAA